jgi:alpha/beta superfamily hydrolase
VKASIALGIPVAAIDNRSYDFEFLKTCSKPNLFVSGGRDQFGPQAALHQLVASVPEPRKLVIIEGADHFFEGRLRELRGEIESWLREVVLP